jgi:hypothetical protein
MAHSKKGILVLAKERLLDSNFINSRQHRLAFLQALWLTECLVISVLIILAPLIISFLYWLCGEGLNEAMFDMLLISLVILIFIPLILFFTEVLVENSFDPEDFEERERDNLLGMIDFFNPIKFYLVVLPGVLFVVLGFGGKKVSD